MLPKKGNFFPFSFLTTFAPAGGTLFSARGLTLQQKRTLMVGLIDIAPSTETVTVQGSPIAVHGVSAKGVAYLLGRFPELRMLMTGQDVETEQLMAMGGDAVAAIISAGCGYPGDEKAEAVAGKLSLDAQADLLASILRLTLPKGIGPFVEKLTALGGILDAAPSDTAPASKLRKPSTR